MNSDIDDPNNHVPEISPDDDWDDLDVVSEKSKRELPPRRTDRGLPLKKAAKGLIVNHHTPPLRIGLEEASGDDSASEEDGEDAGTVGKGKKKRERASAKKAASKSKISEAVEISEPDVDARQEGDESVLSLLQPASAKRLNRQIGTGAKVDTEPSQQPPVPTRSKIAAKNDEEVAMMRRHFVRGERVDWGEVKDKTSNKWIAYTGLGIVLLVVLTVFLGQLPGKKSGRRTEKTFYSEIEPGGLKQKGEEDDLEMLTSQEEARVMYAAYMKARSASEISGLLYNKDEVLPLFEKSWKTGSVPKDWTPGADSLWTVLERDGELYGVFEGRNPDFTRFAVFFRKEDEDLKIDWKATTGFGSSTFEEMKFGKGDGSEIRTWISGADFYTFSLPEENYRSFRLMSPDGDSIIWAYTEIGSELDEELLNLFMPSLITGEAQKKIQVQLSISPGPEDGLPNQWMVRDLLCLSWLDGLKE